MYIHIINLHSRYRKRVSVCNGHAELCDRSYGNITYFGGEFYYACIKMKLNEICST